MHPKNHFFGVCSPYASNFLHVGTFFRFIAILQTDVLMLNPLSLPYV